MSGFNQQDDTAYSRVLPIHGNQLVVWQWKGLQSRLAGGLRDCYSNCVQHVCCAKYWASAGMWCQVQPHMYLHNIYTAYTPAANTWWNCVHCTHYVDAGEQSLAPLSQLPSITWAFVHSYVCNFCIGLGERFNRHDHFVPCTWWFYPLCLFLCNKGFRQILSAKIGL